MIITAVNSGGDSSGRQSHYDDDDEEEITPTEYAEEGTIFVITGSYVGGVSNDTESIEGSGKLSATAYDSTGIEQNVLYSWEAREDSDGMTLTEDGQVSFTKTGTYYVRVKSGPVYSEWLEIMANEKAPARITRVPTPAENTYTGKSVDVLPAEVICEGGTVVYALGTDDSTVPAAYSSEIPKAVETGTYYVWCKALGDADHDNSEPMCITAEIRSASDTPDTDSGNETQDTDTETQDNSKDSGSSGGGCDAGLSALGLGLMVMLLKRRV